MPLVRGHHQYDGRFTQIPNNWLRDKRISLAAKGLIAQLYSHTPGWKVSQESLAFANGIGRDAMRTIINELMKAGYLERSDDRERNEKGYLGGYTYTTKDPWLEPTQDEPTLDQPTQDEPLHKNTNIKNKNLKNNNLTLERFDEFWEIYPKKLDKGAARRAWSSAVKKADPQHIIDRARDYADDPNLPEKRYIKYPASWLNAEAWDNGPLPPDPRRAKEQEKEKHKREIEEMLKNESGRN